MRSNLFGARYKPPLTKNVGDLQWWILHGIVAVNAFMSVLNQNVQACCPFCDQRENISHCFMHCERLRPLFYWRLYLLMLMKCLKWLCLFLVFNIAKGKRGKDGCLILFWVKPKWQFILVGNIKLLMAVVKMFNCCLRDF